MAVTAFAALGVWCVVLSVIDMRQRRLPNVLTGSGAVCIFGYALCTTQFTAAMVGAVLLTAPYLLVHLCAPTSFGAGDVKLAVGLGAATALGGAQTWVWAALAAPMLTAAAGVVMIARNSGPADAEPATRRVLPHGPAMCVATVLALVALRDTTG